VKSTTPANMPYCFCAVQALQESLNQAVQSLIPDAAAAAVLFNNDESASTQAAPITQPAAAAPITASEIIPMQTGHGLALPGKHQQQLQESSSLSEFTPPNIESNTAATAPSYDLQESYIYLEEPATGMLEDYLYDLEPVPVSNTATITSNTAAAAPLPPQLPEDITSSSSSAAAAAAADLHMLTLQGDVMISSRVPVGSVLLQQSITQPLIELAADVARSVFQVLGGFEGRASLQQQQQQPQQQGSPLRLQELEVTVESGSGSSSSSSDLADSPAVAHGSSSSSGSSDEAGSMEISVTVESSRPRPLLSFLRAANKKQAVVQDSLDAAAIAAAVLKALGRRGPEEQQQQEPAALVQPQQMQDMIAELQATVGGLICSSSCKHVAGYACYSSPPVPQSRLLLHLQTCERVMSTCMNHSSQLYLTFEIQTSKIRPWWAGKSSPSVLIT
jgi:hypothetical protein